MPPGGQNPGLAATPEDLVEQGNLQKAGAEKRNVHGGGQFGLKKGQETAARGDSPHPLGFQLPGRGDEGLHSSGSAFSTTRFGEAPRTRL
jgi:hypothetical protein